jgi:ADP-L-glycero-D-manno-heptose 6-epimerase
MNVFVTGGSGFIGSNLVRKLMEDGHKVAMTCSGGENPPSTPHVFGNKLRELPSKAMEFNDVVFHQAANNDTQSKDHIAMQEANVEMPIALFERFADSGCRHFIYASSTAVYGNSPCPYEEESTRLDPLTCYARSKAEFETRAKDFAKSRGVNVIGLRYGNVYGPGENHKGIRSSMIRQMIEAVSVGTKPRLFWDGTQKRDWIYVKDVVRANILAMKYPGSTVLNISSGRSWTFLEVMDLINKHAGQRAKPQYIPNPYVRTYQCHTECNIERASREINFEPLYNLDAGIEEFFKTWT